VGTHHEPNCADRTGTGRESPRRFAYLHFGGGRSHIVVVDAAVVVGAVVGAVLVGCVVVVAGAVVVVVGCAVVVVEASVVVVDWNVVPVVTALDSAAAPVVGADGRTEVPATDGRRVVLGLAVRATARTVVLGLGVRATDAPTMVLWLSPASGPDDGTAVSSGGAVSELPVANDETSAIVDEVVVVEASSNCRAAGGAESVQPTRVIAAAKSTS